MTPDWDIDTCSNEQRHIVIVGTERLAPLI